MPKNTAHSPEKLTKLVSQLIKSQDQLTEELDELRAEIADLRKNGATTVITKSSGREWTEEQRKAAGERLQMGRVKKLGLETIEQLHALSLRPGEKPTKKQIADIKKKFPADGADVEEPEEDVEDDESDDDAPLAYSAEDLQDWTKKKLLQLADEYQVEVPSRTTKADLIAMLAE